MKTIINEKLFQQLQDNPEWETLLNGFDQLKDARIPFPMKKIDRIEVRSNGIYFFDIGIKGNERIVKNDFIIKP